MIIEIRNLASGSIDDQLSVCRNQQLNGIPAYEEGFRRKTEWLKRLLKSARFVSKIAYVDREPVGMVQYYPESCIPFLEKAQKDAVHLDCIFARKDLQGKGIGGVLLKAMIDDVRKSGEFSRIMTTAFDAQSGYPQPDFFRRKGFEQTPGGGDMELQYVLADAKATTRGILKRALTSQPKTVEGEKGIRLFYEPKCQFSTYFGQGAIKLIHEVDPTMKVEEIDMWARPEIAMQLGLREGIIYVHGKPIKEFFMNTEAFKEEIRRATGR